MGRNSKTGELLLGRMPSIHKSTVVTSKNSELSGVFQPEVQPLKVYEIMSFPAVTVDAKEDLKTITTKMLKHRIASVIITGKEGKELGIVTQGDIIRFLASANEKEDIMHHTKARELMSSPLIFIEGDKELEVAARKMAEYKVKKLCVRDANTNLVGMITDNDIMKNASYLIDVLIEMVETGYVKS